MQIAESYSQNMRFIRFAVGPENVHFYKLPGDEAAAGRRTTP